MSVMSMGTQFIALGGLLTAGAATIVFIQPTGAPSPRSVEPSAPQAQIFGSKRGPAWQRWRPAVETGAPYEEKARVYVTGDKVVGEPQLLNLDWTVLTFDEVALKPVELRAERSYAARYDILLFDADRAGRQIAVGGYHHAAGLTVVERWEFLEPVVDFRSSTYKPGEAAKISVLYSGAVAGRQGLRGITNVPNWPNGGAVAAQFADSGDVVLFPNDGSGAIDLFSSVGNPAQHSIAASSTCPFLMCGVVETPLHGSLLILKPDEECYEYATDVRVVLFDSDLDGSFESIQDFSRAEWAAFDFE